MLILVCWRRALGFQVGGGRERERENIPREKGHGKRARRTSKQAFLCPVPPSLTALRLSKVMWQHKGFAVEMLVRLSKGVCFKEAWPFLPKSPPSWSSSCSDVLHRSVARLLHSHNVPMYMHNVHSLSLLAGQQFVCRTHFCFETPDCPKYQVLFPFCIGCRNRPATFPVQVNPQLSVERSTLPREGLSPRSVLSGENPGLNMLGSSVTSAGERQDIFL